MRINLKAKVDACAMCGDEAYDSSGQWYIVKEHSLFFPLGWLPWDVLQDIGMWSLIRAHIICDQHGGHGRHTIITIDGN